MIEQKVLDYSEQLKNLGIEHEIMEHPELKTPQKVVAYLGLTLNDSLPTLLLKADNSFIAFVRHGSTSVDFKLFKKTIGAKDLRMATPEEFTAVTGLSVGAAQVYTPGIKTYIDKKVFNKESLVGGSGSFSFSIRYKTAALRKIPDSVMVDVTSSTKKRVLSGIRATGRLHLGNYLGAVKGMLELQDNPEYETLYMVADVHTITTPYNVEELRKNRREIIIDYLAAGLDPEKSVLFQQSMVNEHIELSFYFSSVTTIAKMQHLPTFKDKVKQHPQNATMALLNYPLLMAADILVYKAGLVPVGIDQEPHLEITREIARSMNQRYGTTFPEPQRFATKGEYVPSLTGSGKMSKSIEGSFINITDSLDEIKSKVARIPTDSGIYATDYTDNFTNIMNFVELFQGRSKREAYEQQYKTSCITYKTVKEELAQAIFDELKPLQEKRKELEANSEYVNRVIAEGAKKARQIARETVVEVKEKMGLL